MQKNSQEKLCTRYRRSRGIGAAIRERLAPRGKEPAYVAITYSRGAEAAASVVKAIEGLGKATVFPGDV